MERIEKSKQLMLSVREVVLSHHEGDVMETTPVDAHVLMMYSRIRSLLEGVCVLFDAQLPEEAIMLGREMFTVSLHLMEMAEQGGDRGALVLGLLSETLTQIEHLERDGLSLGPRDEAYVNRVLERLTIRRQEIDSYRQRNGIGRLKSFRHEKQLARDHGRLDEYLDFRWAHLMVHRSDIAQALRTRKKDVEVLGVYLRNPDSDSVAAASTFAMASALHAHKAVASIFNWTETSPEEIDHLLGEVERLFPSPGDGA